VLGIAAITAAAFCLNAVSAYAISPPGRPRIRPAFTRARSHLGVVLGSGFVVGICLGLSTAVVARWGKFWFGLALSAAVGVRLSTLAAAWHHVPPTKHGPGISRIRNQSGTRQEISAAAARGWPGLGAGPGHPEPRRERARNPQPCQRRSCRLNLNGR